MKIGVVGMGRMGLGIAARLRNDGHTVVAYDQIDAVSDVASLSALVAALEPPRTVWSMLPAGDATENTITELTPLLDADDILVDGANGYYKDAMRRAEALHAAGIAMLDVGVSGGILGEEAGYCLMIGGPEQAVVRLQPIFTALAPQGGFAHVGPSGAGHYVKMIHNGIEYAALQAYAEGFDLLHAANFNIDLPAVAELWNHGSVIQSHLLELTQRALAKDPELASLRGYVDDSGEGRWTVIEALDREVPASTIAQSIFNRFASRQTDSFAMRLIAALRQEFGGHQVQDK
jgi:6-phosphogluconate dehydrogenase